MLGLKVIVLVLLVGAIVPSHATFLDNCDDPGSMIGGGGDSSGDNSDGDGKGDKGGDDGKGDDGDSGGDKDGDGCDGDDNGGGDNDGDKDNGDKSGGDNDGDKDDDGKTGGDDDGDKDNDGKTGKDKGGDYKKGPRGLGKGAPKPGGLGGLLGGLLGGVGKTLDGLLGGFKGDKKGILSILVFAVKDLIKLEIPATVDDVGVVVLKLGVILQKLLDGLIPGLGTSIYKIVASLSQIVICDLGSQGLTGKLLGRRPGSAIPNAAKICKKGFFPEGGLGGDCDRNKAKKVMAEGCKEGKKHLAKINSGKGPSGLGGLLKLVSQILNNLLGLGNKCKASNYKVNLKDFSSVMSEMMVFHAGCAKHYKVPGNDRLPNVFGKTFGKLLGKNGPKTSSIKKRISGCESGPGLEALKG